MNQLFPMIKHKIQHIKGACRTIQAWKENGDRIVFTNGCFDLIHKGHIHYLCEAAELGGRLVVGLNSDASIKRLKGNDRPIKDQDSRLLTMASFQFVDLVVSFEEDTPYLLIESFLPDVLVKGGDWTIDQIVGSDLVLNNGGEVKQLSFIEGCSTTNLINRIKPV